MLIRSKDQPSPFILRKRSGIGKSVLPVPAFDADTWNLVFQITNLKNMITTNDEHGI